RRLLELWKREVDAVEAERGRRFPPNRRRTCQAGEVAEGGHAVACSRVHLGTVGHRTRQRGSTQGSSAGWRGSRLMTLVWASGSGRAATRSVWPSRSVYTYCVY